MFGQTSGFSRRQNGSAFRGAPAPWSHRRSPCSAVQDGRGRRAHRRTSSRSRPGCIAGGSGRPEVRRSVADWYSSSMAPLLAGWQRSFVSGAGGLVTGGTASGSPIATGVAPAVGQCFRSFARHQPVDCHPERTCGYRAADERVERHSGNARHEARSGQERDQQWCTTGRASNGQACNWEFRFHMVFPCPVSIRRVLQVQVA